jgi:hypothetical protein
VLGRLGAQFLLFEWRALLLFDACCLDLPGGRNGGELEDQVGVGFGVGIKGLGRILEDYAGRCGPSRALGPMSSWFIGHNCG